MLLAAELLADPVSLPAWIVLMFAGGLYPLGLMFGCSACCGCTICEGESCCGIYYPRPYGECCGGVWHVDAGTCCDDNWRTDAGTCCDNVWHNDSGECCDSVWYTEEGGCCADVWHSGSGVCCDGMWHTDEGTCCNDVWHPADTDDGQCVCYRGTCIWCPATSKICATSFDDGNPFCCVPVEWDCADVCCNHPQEAPGDAVYLQQGGSCRERCCIDRVCDMKFPPDCEGENLPGACRGQGCPMPCCTEDNDGVTTCAINECQPPGIPDPAATDCTDACAGACCVVDNQNLNDLGSVSCADAGGECHENKTPAECEALGGYFYGTGTSGCGTQNNTECRAPFTAECCESKITQEYGLIFTGPRKKRFPPLEKPTSVRATGYTDSPILIHGTAFGQDGKRCPFDHTFVMCGDKFNIEPLPCGSKFALLDVTVCWVGSATTTETVGFSGCNDITMWLSHCPKSCATTMVYGGLGATSNARIEIGGDATIQADGGALVLTTALVMLESCDRTLTLTGSSTAGNTIPAIGNPAGYKTAVAKIGNGRWRFASASSYTGQTTILQGTVVVASNAPFTGNGALGYSNTGGFGGGSSPIPIVGDASAGASGVAALLLSGGTQFDRSLAVAGGGSSQLVILGGANTSGTTEFTNQAAIFLGRDVTLQAATGGTVRFANEWAGPAVGDPVTASVTIGTAGNAGTVVIGGSLATTGTLTVAYGQLVIEQIASGAGNLTSATFTASTLTIAFSSNPSSGAQYVLLTGPTGNSYAASDVTLTGTSATGTYDSATSTLTID